MLMFLFLFAILGFVAFMLRNAEFLGWLIVTLLVMLSIFTPFWPFVLLGIIGMVKIRHDDYKHRRRIDAYRKQAQMKRKEDKRV